MTWQDAKEMMVDFQVSDHSLRDCFTTFVSFWRFLSFQNMIIFWWKPKVVYVPKTTQIAGTEVSEQQQVIMFLSEQVI